ncbi:MAG: ABC transporter permease [Bauldia sp.]|nr:ABC transporter permease [Bauldia sp.]
MSTVRDTWLIYTRAMTINLNNPFWVIIGLLQPIIYLVLFAPLLEGMGLGANAYNIFVPGLLVLNAMFGSLFVGFGLLQELGEGVIERMRVTPISRLSMLLGRVFRDITTFLFQSLILLVLAIPFGLDVNVGGAILTFLMLILIGLVLAPLSYAIALAVKTLDGFAGFINMFSLPLMLLSGILLPINDFTAPGWLVAIAKVNPFYYAVEGVRALFVGDFGNSNLWIGVGLMAALAVLLLVIGARAFGRAVR